MRPIIPGIPLPVFSAPGYFHLHLPDLISPDLPFPCLNVTSCQRVQVMTSGGQDRMARWCRCGLREKTETVIEKGRLSHHGHGSSRGLRESRGKLTLSSRRLMSSVLSLEHEGLWSVQKGEQLVSWYYNYVALCRKVSSLPQFL